MTPLKITDDHMRSTYNARRVETDEMELVVRYANKMMEYLVHISGSKFSVYKVLEKDVNCAE